MPHFVRVELSDDTAARLGRLSTATGAPPDALVRAAVEARYGRRTAARRPPARRLRRPADEPAVPVEYGGEG